MTQRPRIHGRDHRPGGADPIPGLSDALHWGNNTDTDSLGLTLNAQDDVAVDTGTTGAEINLTRDHSEIQMRDDDSINVESVAQDAYLFLSGIDGHIDLHAEEADINIECETSGTLRLGGGGNIAATGTDINVAANESVNVTQHDDSTWNISTTNKTLIFKDHSANPIVTVTG